MASQRKLTLACISGHKEEKEAADDLARQYSSRIFVGAGPFVGTTKSQIIKSINE